MDVKVRRFRALYSFAKRRTHSCKYRRIVPSTDLDASDTIELSERRKDNGEIDIEELLIGALSVLILDLDNGDLAPPGIEEQPIGLTPFRATLSVCVVEPQRGQVARKARFELLMDLLLVEFTFSPSAGSLMRSDK
jgi:hypothetical protein